MLGHDVLMARGLQRLGRELGNVVNDKIVALAARGGSEVWPFHQETRPDYEHPS
jgi:hypothetical protein